MLTKSCSIADFLTRIRSVGTVLGALAFIVFEAIRVLITLGDFVMHSPAFQRGLDWLLITGGYAPGYNRQRLKLLRVFVFPAYGRNFKPPASRVVVDLKNKTTSPAAPRLKVLKP